MPGETQVHAAVLAGVASGVTPAVSLAYGDSGGDADVFAAGRTQLGDGGEPVTPDTRFDVASLTKPVTTTAVLMRLVAEGTVSLDDPLQRFVPAAAGDVTLAQLVGHSSGYPAHIEFFRRLLAGDLAGQPTARQAIVQLAATTPQTYRPGTQTIYSDLGFILLATCLERATGERLDALTERLVTEPLAMRATGFVDLTASPPAPRPHPIAATEVCPYRGLVRGEVHDDNCHAAGGICGHAGLFSTASDLARFARAMIAAARGEPGLFAPAVVRTFISTSAAPETTWRLGWDRPAPLPSQSHAGDLWPRDGVGHLGFTGCSMWLDPPRGRYAILLTNRVHPSRDKVGILEVRRAYMDAAWRALNAR
ncbi:MAG TPA: serine hydrolase domain-containing protein [Kofleriaceae bacterium]|nr:serine hydrolase domain-containing protein [Kofleriaceae bacterium]